LATLSEWGSVLDAMPQPRPVAVAFFTVDAVRDFLKQAMAARGEFNLPPCFYDENEAETDTAKAAGGAK
jgi:hypothetical protein